MDDFVCLREAPFYYIRNDRYFLILKKGAATYNIWYIE